MIDIVNERCEDADVKLLTESTPAKVGDRLRFEYPGWPTYNCDLIVVKVVGTQQNDLVFFHDGTHSKQKHLTLIPRIE